VQLHNFLYRRLIGAAAIVCAALIPTAASAATAGSPAAAARPAGLVIAYVVNQGNCNGGHTVTPIDTATNTALKAINVGKGPNAIAVTPDGKTAYVVSGGEFAGTCGEGSGPANTVTPIRTATNTALKAIKVGNFPDAIVITPNGKTAYVSNGGNGAAPGNTVTPIDTATNTALKAIKVGSGADAIAITPNGKTAYVVNGFSGTVTPISTATNTAGKAIKVAQATDILNGPSSIAITPNGKTAYVSIPSMSIRTGQTADTVTPIRTATNTALSAIKVGYYPHAIAITPDGKTAYVLACGHMVPINTATNTAGKTIVTGGLANIGITPNGKTAYVLNDVSEPGTEPGTVIPISTATNTVGKAITVGSGPVAIAFTP